MKEPQTLEESRALRDAECAKAEAKAMLWPCVIKLLQQCEDEMCRQTFKGARRSDLNWVIDKTRAVLKKAKELGIDQ